MLLTNNLYTVPKAVVGMCHLQTWAAKLSLGQWKCSCWCTGGEEVKGKRRAQRRRKESESSWRHCESLPCKPLKAWHWCKWFMLRSMPVPAIIHAGGLVFLWKGNDYGRPPTHWNCACKQGTICFVRAGSESVLCSMVLVVEFSLFFPRGSLDLASPVVAVKFHLCMWCVW